MYCLVIGDSLDPGFGPAASALDVQPVDLRHGYSDAGELFRGITLGVEDSPMPGFENFGAWGNPGPREPRTVAYEELGGK